MSYHTHRATLNTYIGQKVVEPWINTVAVSGFQIVEMEDITVSSLISAELSSLGIGEASSTNSVHEVRPTTEATVNVLVRLNPEDSIPSKSAMRRAAHDKTRYARRQAMHAERKARQQKAEGATENNVQAKHEDLPQLEPKPRMTRTAQKARNSAHENQMNRMYGYHDYEAKALEDALNNMQLGDAVPKGPPKGPRRRNKMDTRKNRKRLEEKAQTAILANASGAAPLSDLDKAGVRLIRNRLKEEAEKAILENAFGVAPSSNSAEKQKVEVGEFQRICKSYRDLSGNQISDRLVNPMMDSAQQPMQNQDLEIAQAILRQNSCGQKHNWGKVFQMLSKPHKKGGEFWTSDYAMALVFVAKAEVSRQLNAFNNQKPGELTLGLWRRKQMLRRQFVLKCAEESSLAAKEEEQENRDHFREIHAHVKQEGSAVNKDLAINSVDNETLDAIEGTSAQLP